MTDANYTYYGDHFAIHTYIKSLCCILETNIMSTISQFKKFLNKIEHRHLLWADYVLESRNAGD